MQPKANYYTIFLHSRELLELYGPQFGIDIDDLDLPSGLDFILNTQFTDFITFIDDDITKDGGEYEDDIVNTVAVDDLLYQVLELHTYVVLVLCIQGN